MIAAIGAERGCAERQAWGYAPTNSGEEAKQEATERRQREDDAGRLKEHIPLLATLRLELRETRSERALRGTAHVRHIVVAQAPALFEFPCRDEFCRDGGHDITHEVLHELRAGRTVFAGKDGCGGGVGSASCERVLHFVAAATYRDGGTDPTEPQKPPFGCGDPRFSADGWP